jgi:hypothetical protein
MSIPIRYIRDYIQGHYADTFADSQNDKLWAEIYAIEIDPNGTEINRALGKIVTGLNGLVYTDLNFVTDGLDTIWTQCLDVGVGGVQIDLGAIYNIDYIKIKHKYDSLTPMIFYNHSLEVSEDDITWYTIISGDSQTREIIDGHSYWLPFDLSSKVFVEQSDIQKIFKAVKSCRTRKIYEETGITDPSGEGEEIFISDFTNLRSWLDDAISVLWSESFSDNDSKIEKSDLQEFSFNIFQAAQTNTVCNSGCAHLCSDNCSGLCFGTCGIGCGNACSGTCGQTCYLDCGTVCSSGCGGACSGGCASACGGGCVGRCASGSYGAGIDICAGTCDQACCMACGVSACAHDCGAGCSYACGATCDIVCGGECSGACGLICSAGCGEACTNSCQSGCSNGCMTTCISGCGGTCTGLAN